MTKNHNDFNDAKNHKGDKNVIDDKGGKGDDDNDKNCYTLRPP